MFSDLIRKQTMAMAAQATTDPIHRIVKSKRKSSNVPSNSSLT